MTIGLSRYLAGLAMMLAAPSLFAQKIDQCEGNTKFNIGAGIYDITGPAAEVGMMGYGMLNQQTAGISQRLWARAFVIESPCNSKRVAIVNADLGQIFQGIKQQVVKKLKITFGDLYGDENVLLTATHTHSGPGGFSTYAFYNLTTLGFNRDNFNTIVNGIVAAITRAQNNMADATIKVARGELPDIGFNRSPDAYAQNPHEERHHYSRNVDTEMTLLRFDSADGKPIGMINWFPLHGVSMNNKNHLITGDNKGYAEYLFEKDFTSDYGVNAFVAAFAQANAGDVSPNKLGHEGGSGIAGINAITKAGEAQYKVAKQLYTNAKELLVGGIAYRHRFIEMNDVMVEPAFTKAGWQVTCPAAIGISMLAGTQDGEGVGQQGITCATIPKYIPRFICEMRTTSCQGVKPIALSTGLMKPYPWTPNILPLQIIKIGKVTIAAAPFELTTMSGRRIRETIQNLPAFKNNLVLLATLANAYSGYVATKEEYQMQRYEGASTHFGPYTLSALQQEFSRLATALALDKEVTKGPEPIDLSGFQINLQPGVVFDAAPFTKHFGDVYQNVKRSYHPGETVSVKFWGAHPKNNFRIQDSFLGVQRFENNTWQTIRTDNDIDTEYHWERSGIASSIITIVWRTSADLVPGKYRILHYGDAKPIVGKTVPYVGYSGVFDIS